MERRCNAIGILIYFWQEYTIQVLCVTVWPYLLNAKACMSYDPHIQFQLSICLREMYVLHMDIDMTPHFFGSCLRLESIKHVPLTS